MRLWKFLYSLFFLGLLFFVHLLKYPFEKFISSSDFIDKFKADGIDGIDQGRLDRILESSNCISCNICSMHNFGRGEYLDNSDICSRLTREPTRVGYIKDGFSMREGSIVADKECPYGIEIGNISRTISD